MQRFVSFKKGTNHISTCTYESNCYNGLLVVRELLDNSLRNDCQSINDIDNIMNKLQDVTETFVMDGMVSKIYNFVIDV